MFEKNAVVYFIGIKGTGMSALAELFAASGFSVSGSDTQDVFYTDAILRSAGIPFYETFDEKHVPEKAIVVYSAAYDEKNNPEIARAAGMGLTMMNYPAALGEWSKRFDSAGIAGVHGKTTTTALSGALVRALNIPAQVLAGSAAFGGANHPSSVLNNGGRFFIAETCEYRKHFLAFSPKHIVLTAVECDHQDFFHDYNSIRGAFVEYAQKLPAGGNLIYCEDDAGARETADIIKKEKRKINFIPYGFTADGDFHLSNYRVENEKAFFKINCFDDEFTLCIPGKYNALNAAAAAALILQLTGGGKLFEKEIRSALSSYKGSKRRQEILGEKKGVLFMDDYAHHPTAISATLKGIKEFYPKRRIIVSFMAHTYSRTAALLNEFAESFALADIVILHKIYASARENQLEHKINGRSLFEKTKALKNNVYYIDEHEEASDFISDLLREGDLFITMGAGDNFRLGEKLFSIWSEK